MALANFVDLTWSQTGILLFGVQRLEIAALGASGDCLWGDFLLLVASVHDFKVLRGEIQFPLLFRLGGFLPWEAGRKIRCNVVVLVVELEFGMERFVCFRVDSVDFHRVPRRILVVQTYDEFLHKGSRVTIRRVADSKSDSPENTVVLGGYQLFGRRDLEFDYVAAWSWEWESELAEVIPGHSEPGYVATWSGSSELDRIEVVLWSFLNDGQWSWNPELDRSKVVLWRLLDGSEWSWDVELDCIAFVTWRFLRDGWK